MSRLAFGFTGEMGSGKTTASAHLAQAYSLQYIRYSQVLDDWLGTGPSKAALQMVGSTLMSEGGQAELNRQLLLRLGPDQDSVIDGIRHPLDVKTMRKHFGPGFRLIFVETAPESRFSRLGDRFDTRDAFTKAGNARSERHIQDLRHDSDKILTNEGSLQSMLNTLDMYYRKVVGEAE